MRHGKQHNHLGRKTAHRHALLANMASSLIIHKRIETTVAKAKALRMFVEPLITKAKDDKTHNRRVVFAYLTDKEAIKELFGIVAEKVADRPGGYTRIIKLPNRLGDNAEMCMMELVDFNEVMLAESADKPVKTRRSRRAGSSGASAEKKEVVAPVAAAVVAEAPSAEVIEEEEAVAEVIEETVETPVAEVETTEPTPEATETDEAADSEEKPKE
ncbi:MAG: 50S ribosomal protein L17 [Bacteroidota bacterium]